jgi:hypothetical protein
MPRGRFLPCRPRSGDERRRLLPRHGRETPVSPGDLSGGEADPRERARDPVRRPRALSTNRMAVFVGSRRRHAELPEQRECHAPGTRYPSARNAPSSLAGSRCCDNLALQRQRASNCRHRACGRSARWGPTNPSRPPRLRDGPAVPKQQLQAAARRSDASAPPRMASAPSAGESFSEGRRNSPIRAAIFMLMRASTASGRPSRACSVPVPKPRGLEELCGVGPGRARVTRGETDPARFSRRACSRRPGPYPTPWRTSSDVTRRWEEDVLSLRDIRAPVLDLDRGGPRPPGRCCATRCSCRRHRAHADSGAGYRRRRRVRSWQRGGEMPGIASAPSLRVRGCGRRPRP